MVKSHLFSVFSVFSVRTYFCDFWCVEYSAGGRRRLKQAAEFVLGEGVGGFAGGVEDDVDAAGEGVAKNVARGEEGEDAIAGAQRAVEFIGVAGDRGFGRKAEDAGNGFDDFWRGHRLIRVRGNQ